MIFCRGINVNKVMKLLAFISEQPSYQADHDFCHLLSRLLIFLGSLYCKLYETRSESDQGS